MGSMAELSMGPFCVIRSNPAHHAPDWPNPTEPNTTNNGTYSLVVTYSYTQNILYKISYF